MLYRSCHYSNIQSRFQHQKIQWLPNTEIFIVQKHNLPECCAAQHYVGVLAVCVMHVHVARDMSHTLFSVMVSHLD